MTGIRMRVRHAAILGALAAMFVGVGIAGTPASAATYDPADPAYASWNAAQYDAPQNTGGVDTLEVSDLDTRAMQTSRFSVSGMSPAASVDRTAIIVNDLKYPVRISFVGGADSGTIAPYLFEWITGWRDVTLQPGASTSAFELGFGMPYTAPDAAESTTGAVWWQWKYARLAQPVAVADHRRTPYDTAIRIDVLANDHLDDGSPLPAGTTVSGIHGHSTQGTWTVNSDGTVTFTPAPGFSGTATASYTITTPDGQTATGTITVVVEKSMTEPPFVTSATPSETKRPSPPGYSVHTGGAAAAGAIGGPAALRPLAELGKLIESIWENPGT